MLNQHLPAHLLEKTFDKEQLRRLDDILDIVDQNKSKRIIQDQRLLGEIHHAVNIHRYRDQKFRLLLLRHAPPQLIKKYASNLEIKSRLPNPNEPAYRKFIEKMSKFDWGDNNSSRLFIESFGYPNYIIMQKDANEENPEIIAPVTPSLKPLLEYQTGIFFKAIKELEVPSNRFIIQMPTGTGKTRTAMEIISYFMNSRIKSSIVWIANREELLDQALEAFKEVWVHIGNKKVNIYKLWGNRTLPSIDHKESSFIIMGYDKFNNILDMDRKRFKPNLVVVDEAHQVIAPTYKTALNKLTEDFETGTIVIGLSATPGRGLNATQNELLAAEFMYKRIGVDVPESVENADEHNYEIAEEEFVIDYLIKNEILSRIEPETLYTYSHFFLTSKESNALTKMIEGDYPEYSDEFREALSADNRRNIPIVRRLIELAEEKRQILYFATSTSQSLLVYAALLKLGIPATHVDAKTDKVFRKGIVDKFKEREINVICNYNIFSTGFDAPNIDVVFIARPVNSPVLYSQMVGRGTRGIRMGGKEKFTLIQVVDDIESESHTFDPYANYTLFAPHWRQEK